MHRMGSQHASERAATPRLMILSLVIGATWSATAALAGDPQPGDVVDPAPVVDGTAPAIADAGPGEGDEDEAEPTAVTTSPSVTEAAPAEDAAATAAAPDADAARAAPAPAADPKVDDTRPTVDDTAPRPDPAAERHDDPAAAAPEVKQAASSHEPWDTKGFGFGGVPALNYDADNGFGFGVVGTLYWYDGVTRPYRLAVTLQIFMTSKLVQDHNVVVDWLRAGDLPLRVSTRVGYLQSLSQNYCGFGGDVTCDPAVAVEEAKRAGLVDEEADTFASRYYKRRFINPYALVQARYTLVEKPARFEVMGGYRGFSFLPGSWDDEDKDGRPDLFPYAGSLYAKEHPDGEPGFDSAVQLGVMIDSRDNEPSPTQGLWAESSVRVASSLLGSTWSWAGGNLTLRAYAPFTDDHTLVLADRFVLDGVVGDPPIQELARVGGSADHYIYGGSEAGRGIRAQRYLGKLRMYNQTEARWRFWEAPEFLGQHFAFTGVAFLDAGVVGREIFDPGPMDLAVGYGGALRVSWNENFIVRFDLGFSPIEDDVPSLYVTIGNPF
jgi:hypothetical protein